MASDRCWKSSMRPSVARTTRRYDPSLGYKGLNGLKTPRELSVRAALIYSFMLLLFFCYNCSRLA